MNPGHAARTQRGGYPVLPAGRCTRQDSLRRIHPPPRRESQSVARDHVVSVRLSDAELAQVEAAARERGETIAEYLRRAGLASATESRTTKKTGIRFSIAGAVYEDALARVDGLPEPRENRVIGVGRTVEYETSPAGVRRILSALDRAAGDSSLSYYRRSTIRKHARILRGLLADDQR